jgi:hypothetical protein
VADISARDALGVALERENLLLYSVVIAGWFVFSGGVQRLTYALTNVVPELRVLFAVVRVAVEVGGAVAVLAGLVALVHRTVGEAPAER